MTGYLLLFVTAFAAATILPFYSEVLLVSLLLAGFSPPWLWLAATIGNTLGAVVNWYMGKYLVHFENRSWFPFKANKLHRVQRWYQKFGVWSLLLSWAPIGGDALTFIAGMMRVKLWQLVVLCAIGKGARYAVVISLTLQTQ